MILATTGDLRGTTTRDRIGTATGDLIGATDSLQINDSPFVWYEVSLANECSNAVYEIRKAEIGTHRRSAIVTERVGVMGAVAETTGRTGGAATSGAVRTYRDRVLIAWWMTQP